MPGDAAAYSESSISRTATASCFNENGFGKKPNFASAGRLRANASSAYPETKMNFRSG